MTLDEKKARLKAVLAEKRELILEGMRLEAEIAAEESPVKVDDVIEWKYGSTGRRRGRVVGVRRGITSFVYEVVPLKNDGTEGVAFEVRQHHKPELVRST